MTAEVGNFHSKNRRGIDGHAEINVTASRAPICRLKERWNVVQMKACLVNIWWLDDVIYYLYGFSSKTITVLYDTYIKILKHVCIKKYVVFLFFHLMVSRTKVGNFELHYFFEWKKRRNNGIIFEQFYFLKQIK